MATKPTLTKVCTCFDDNMKIAKERILAALPPDVIDVEVRWKDYAYFMSGDYSPVNPRFAYEYRLPKKGGGYRANLSKSETTLTACFCCYCGRKLNKGNK